MGMIRAEIDTSDVAVLAGQLRELGRRGTENALRASMRTTMRAVREATKPLIPVRTGALKRSFEIRTPMERKGVAAGVYGVKNDFKVTVVIHNWREQTGRVLRRKNGEWVLRPGESHNDIVTKQPWQYAYKVDRQHGFMQKGYETARDVLPERLGAAMKVEVERRLIAKRNDGAWRMRAG